LWNLLWQIIIAKELIRRFQHGRKNGWTSGVTARVIASMIVADRWLKHIDIVLVELKIPLSEMKPPETEELKAKAEDFKKKGNEALSKQDYTKAIVLYTEAMKIDPRNAVYRNNRSAASYSLEQYEDALEDAYVATRLDPKYAKAWSRYGLAAIKVGLGKRAIGAYEQGIAVAGKDASDLMRRGLTAAKAKNEADIKAINDEKDEKKRDILLKEYLEQDFDIFMKSIEVHSRVHEQQTEGLLYFAEKLKWPWINEVRDYCEEAYSNLRGGETLPLDLHDWLFGMMLPGQWFSFKIMAALVLSTASIRESLGVAVYYDCGLALPKKSYWRIRTVLGRVLGCTPGVISLCGWIGPCPPVEFIPPLLEKKPCYVRLKARQVSLVEHKAFQDGEPIYIGGSEDSNTEISIRPDEEVEPWMLEIRDASNWVVPEPPVRQVSTCEMKAIQLKRDLSAKEKDDDDQDVYRAQVVFKMDDSDDLITYKLFTNPVFVTVPPCHGGPKRVHEVHLRELYRYDEKNIWTIERLKEHTPEDTEETDVMIINATGKGAELLARAWCSERGKNAVIRRDGGPCFVCAERAASSTGLRTGILIWVS
jgi:tetratricopeptide (TPR) repeat protein